MESLIILLALAFSAMLVFFRNFRSKKLPPGPPGWPIIGNMLDLLTMPHQKMSSMSKQYGPVVWLQVGVQKTLVVNSAESAKELFKNYDLCFADRALTETMKSCNFHESSMSVGQYSPYWRLVRGLYSTELFNAKRMNETKDLRRKCVDNMINWISEESDKVGSVEIAKFVFLMAFNLQSNLIFTHDVAELQCIEEMEFFKITSGFAEIAGLPNLSDFFPVLKPFDFQGLKKKMDRALERALSVISELVNERIQDRSLTCKHQKQKDFLDVLLDFKGNGTTEPAKLTHKDICCLIVELFTAGSETTNSTIEWIMTELLRNPKAMKKVQAELDQVVGQSRKVEESDIENLRYLGAVIKESLRLHPAIPLLIPRRAVENVEFIGYKIPKNTQVLVNIWSIGRDPKAWDDPLVFRPERFLEQYADVDYKGQHFELMPFGAGRRICAGLPLGDKVLHLVLASLLHTFDWVLEGNAAPESIDMTERIGVALRKAIPLRAIAKHRVL